MGVAAWLATVSYIHDITVCGRFVGNINLGGQSVRVALRTQREQNCVGALQESCLHHPQTHPIYASNSQSRIERKSESETERERMKERDRQTEVAHMYFSTSELSFKK